MNLAPGKGNDPTLRDALQRALATGLDRLDAQVLLLHTLGREGHDRAWLIAHDLDPLPPPLDQRFEQLCLSRRAGAPVAYLVGQREFHGLTLQVDARVLDPRPDTETLVDWALECLHGWPTPHVLDLGTGSGAIALALQHRRPDATVWALDRSTDALAVAQANARQLKLPVHLAQGCWLQNGLQPWQHSHTAPDRFDLIVSNPPYIPERDPHLVALSHEPWDALASGPDGLDDLRTIVTQAPAWLMPSGWLLLEHGWDQGPAVAHLLDQAGLCAVQHRHDLAGQVRCTGARTPGSNNPGTPALSPGAR